jgi:hypothetical protein
MKLLQLSSHYEKLEDAQLRARSWRENTGIFSPILLAAFFAEFSLSRSQLDARVYLKGELIME